MNYYNEIKEILINNEITKKVKDYSKNKSDLESYYKVGQMLLEAQGGLNRAKYGDNIIKEYAQKLTIELGKGYTFTSLSRMRKFYVVFQNVATLSQYLTWSHYSELLVIDDINAINYYIKMSEIYNLSVRELRKKIKSKEYERLDDSTKQELINQEKHEITDFVKNPIIINNSYNYKDISERVLKILIFEDMDSFLSELGNGFCYIKNEYKIKIGDRYNYIDMLLFNIEYNCYVVLELKVTELKKEYTVQHILLVNILHIKCKLLKNLKSFIYKEF